MSDITYLTQSPAPLIIVLLVLAAIGGWMYTQWKESKERKYQLTVLGYTIDTDGTKVKDDWDTCVQFMKIVNDPEIEIVTRRSKPEE